MNTKKFKVLQNFVNKNTVIECGCFNELVTGIELIDGNIVISTSTRKWQFISPSMYYLNRKYNIIEIRSLYYEY